MRHALIAILLVSACGSPEEDVPDECAGVTTRMTYRTFVSL